MKTIILYASKSGASEKVSNYMQNKIPDCNVHNIAFGVPDLIDYNNVILGSGIYFLKIHRLLRKLIKANKKVLAHKNVFIFYACASTSKKDT